MCQLAEEKQQLTDYLFLHMDDDHPEFTQKLNRLVEISTYDEVLIFCGTILFEPEND